MKIQLIVRFTIFFISFFALAHLSSFAQKKVVSFNNSTVVPGAEGKVKVKKDKNNNFDIEIDIENLADSKKLTPAKKTYVVWIETVEKGVKNIGQINSSSSMFSKTKKASISTVSPHKPVRIFITAEDDGSIEEPGTTIVLTTDSFH